MSCWHTAYWLRESFIDENCSKFLNGILDCLTERGRREERKALQRWHAFFSFRNVHSCKRSGQNVHGPFSPEHISSNAPSVFFSRKRQNPRKHSNVTGGEMSHQCLARAELNIIRFQTSTGSYQTHNSNVIMTGPLLRPTLLSTSSL